MSPQHALKDCHLEELLTLIGLATGGY
jgi:hypothetical protein